jgi:hypothetical protein
VTARTVIDLEPEGKIEVAGWSSGSSTLGGTVSIDLEGAGGIPGDENRGSVTLTPALARTMAVALLDAAEEADR